VRTRNPPAHEYLARRRGKSSGKSSMTCARIASRSLPRAAVSDSVRATLRTVRMTRPWWISSHLSPRSSGTSLLALVRIRNYECDLIRSYLEHRHRDRKRSSASMSSEWDRGRYPSIYLREEQALIELAQQGGIAVDESGRFLVRPKLDAPAVPPLPAEYRDQAHVVVDSATAAQPLELPGPNRSDDATPTHADPSSSPLAR
jgi:hypothetical protein